MTAWLTAAPLLPPQEEERPLECWFDAATRGDAEALQRLASRVSVDVLNGWQQQTALHLAALSGSLQAVQVLLAGGANVASADRIQQQPLHVAARRFDASQAVPIIRALLDAGAPLLAVDQHRWTPAYKAACRGNVEALTALLDAGTPVDVGQGRQDDTLLETVCRVSQPSRRGPSGAAAAAARRSSEP